MKLAEEIAIAHHEKWDGTGYPNKMKGARNIDGGTNSIRSRCF